MTSNEVDSAVGAGAERVDVIAQLAEKKAALVAAEKDYTTCKEMRDEEGLAIAGRLRDALKIIIADLETETAVVIEARGKKEAEQRMTEIKRAAGGLRAALAGYDKGILAQQKKTAEDNAARTAIARKYEMLEAEARALADRCELPTVRLEPIIEPPPIEALSPWRYHLVPAGLPDLCEHNLRKRRSYSEVAGTEGYAIIMRMGLRPFRQLTESERAFLEDKVDWKPDPVLAQAAVEAHALGNLGVPVGRVARG